MATSQITPAQIAENLAAIGIDAKRNAEILESVRIYGKKFSYQIHGKSAVTFALQYFASAKSMRFAVAEGHVRIALASDKKKYRTISEAQKSI